LLALVPLTSRAAKSSDEDVLGVGVGIGSESGIELGLAIGLGMGSAVAAALGVVVAAASGEVTGRAWACPQATAISKSATTSRRMTH
jgi:hypothetical protein